jgi:murein DD-endopeptidase MepM/ murein hydrolase activator NlpD
MVADTSSRGRRLFPEIRVRFRAAGRSPQFVLPSLVQVAAVFAVIAPAAAFSCLAVSRIGHDRRLADKEAEVIRTETANADLQDEAASLRDKLAAAARERDQADARSSALAARADFLRGLLATGKAKLRSLDEPRNPRSQPCGEMRRQPTTSELEQNRSQRAIPRAPKPVGFRLAGLITTEPAEPEADPQRPEVVITGAPPEPERKSPGVAELGRRAINEFRSILASTGLNVERLFPQFRLDRAEGGPFVPPPNGDQPGGISPDHLEAMLSLIKSLPLSTPLDHYQLESRFGPRHDPFNRRLSFHTGIDLSGPYMSPVYATAGGIVTYAGYRADYGKAVEIAHGNGISTVYGHLHRYIVSVGQSVAEHTQIGFLGSTGRSSGPHVHYEILVNDEPQDPEKFLGLPRLIPVAEK